MPITSPRASSSATRNRSRSNSDTSGFSSTAATSAANSSPWQLATYPAQTAHCPNPYILARATGLGAGCNVATYMVQWCGCLRVSHPAQQQRPWAQRRVHNTIVRHQRHLAGESTLQIDAVRLLFTHQRRQRATRSMRLAADLLPINNYIAVRAVSLADWVQRREVRLELQLTEWATQQRAVPRRVIYGLLAYNRSFRNRA